MRSFSKEEIQALKENKEVLYFYKLPCSLFDSGFQYIIVTDAPEPPEKYDNVKWEFAPNSLHITWKIL